MTSGYSLQNEPCPFGANLQHYWDRLSPLERKMKLSEEGLYSLALQPTMVEVAQAIRGESVLDGFCGFGGSAIGLARAGKRVIAMDIDPARVEAAQANAALFGVADRITFRVGDMRELMSSTSTDAIFLDPPWGGPGYVQKKRFSLADFSPNGEELLLEALKRYESVVLRVPRNFAWDEFAPFNGQVGFHIQTNSHHRELLHFTVFINGQARTRLLRQLSARAH